MDTIPRWLASYGLTNSEIRVYLAILQHRDTKVSDIQRRTGLVRTTLYYVLGKLKSSGLVSENQQNNVKTYRVTDIKNLEHKIESEIAEQHHKLEALSTLAPLFQKLQSAPADRESYVSRYEGIGPVKQAIEDALRCKSKQWLVIAARDNFLFHTTKEYKKYYLEERTRRGITAKSLWEPVGDLKAKDEEAMLHRNPRYLPEQFRGAFKSLVIIYDDTTLVIDPYAQKTAHAIHNAASTQLLRLLFEAVWQEAK